MVGMHDTLGQSRGARGIHDVQHVVIARRNLGLRGITGIAKASIVLGKVSGIAIGHLSQNFKPPTELRCITARVHAIVVWRQRDSSAEYADRCQCERWEVVVPELVFGR